MNTYVDPEGLIGGLRSSDPEAPQTIEETGLDSGFLVALMLKTMYRMSLETPTQLSASMKLSKTVLADMIQEAVDQRLIETLGQRGASFTAEMRYALTGKGREWALEALAQNEWVGPAPVTLECYSAQIEAQSIRNITLTRRKLERVFQEMTLSADLMEKLGPAANCSASVLLYGPPGNGKSTIAEAICTAFGGVVHVPHALVIDQQIITVYDPNVHKVVSPSDSDGDPVALRRKVESDRRFVPCRRPAVITGGELTLDRLDVAFNGVSRLYEAPMQMKASGGVLVIDDFGRQAQSPQALINRMIIPLENKRDFLSLETGRKFEVPFDTLVIFSTNIKPKELVDDAALRRLRYKILVDKPDTESFVTIFDNTARKFGMQLTEESLMHVISNLYGETPGAEFAGFHPRFLIDQVQSISAFEGVEPELRPEFLNRAWANLFTAD